MHSIHTLQTHSDHQEAMQTSLNEAQQQQQAAHQITVLEPSVSSIQQQQSQAQSGPTYQATNEQHQQEQSQLMLLDGQHQHLSQQPHLHQLQPNNGNQQNSMSEQATIDELQLHKQQSSGNSENLNQQQFRQKSEAANNCNIVPLHDGGPIIQWLLEKYEIAEGESLPRSTVYNHYLAYCRSNQLASVNAASFGKMIRSVFLGLKTRRLGTRGHSKYHYFGVRAKQHVQQELLQHGGHDATGPGSSINLNGNNENSNQNVTDNGSDETDSTGNLNDCNGRLSSTSGSVVKRVCRSSMQHHNQLYSDSMVQMHPQPDDPSGMKTGLAHSVASDNNNVYYTNLDHGCSIGNGYHSSPVKLDSHSQIVGQLDQQIHHTNSNHQQQHQKYHSQEHLNQPRQQQVALHYDLADFRNHLGANWATLVDEHWPPATALGELNVNPELMEVFESKYKLYYKRMVELLSELKFLNVQQLWYEFWHPPLTNETNSNNNNAPNSDSNDTNANANNATTNTEQPARQHDWAQSSSSSGATTQRANELSGSGACDMIQHVDFEQPFHQAHHGQLQQQQAYQQQPQRELAFHQLYTLSSRPEVIERINQIDYSLYAAIEQFLLPDMLSPIPRLLAQQIRLFAKDFGKWIRASVDGYDAQFVEEKSKSAQAFGYALRSYTSLNHLSTASRAIWEKRSSLMQMSQDLSRVELSDIEHQVSLMSHGGNWSTSLSILAGQDESARLRANEINEDNCSTTSTNDTSNTSRRLNHQVRVQHLRALQPGQLTELISNFIHLLEDPYPANSWPDWCRNLVESKVAGLSLAEASDFILKWNFYISLIMKELTLRSAPSFGSFQLIRLLFDEYIFYLVVTRLAQAQNKTPAQMLSI